MTTYLLNCPSGTDSDDCGVPDGGVTVAQGHSTVEVGYGAHSV